MGSFWFFLSVLVSWLVGCIFEEEMDCMNCGDGIGGADLDGFAELRTKL